jgi:hypothetical protein
VDLHLPGEAVSQYAVGCGVSAHVAVKAVRQEGCEEVVHGARNRVARSYIPPNDPADYKAAARASGPVSANGQASTSANANANAHISDSDGRGATAGTTSVPYEAAGFWRAGLHNDLPVASYAATPSEAARGPCYRRHRFVSGKFCSVRVDNTAVGDLRIVLSAPENGKYGQAVAYDWHPLDIYLTKQEVAAYVACYCASEEEEGVYSVPSKFRGNVELLAPSHRQELCELLLSAVVLDTGG